MSGSRSTADWSRVEVALLLLQAALMSASEKYDASLAPLNTAIGKYPKDPRAYIRKIEILDKLDRHEDALECCNQALSIDYENTSLHITKASILNRLHRPSEALECINPVLKSPTENLSALLCKSNALISLERYEEGLVCIDSALKIYPKDPDLLVAKANTLILLYRPKEALPHAEEVLALNYGNIGALVVQATVLMELHNFEGALSCCNRALYIDSNHQEALVTKSKALNELGKPGEGLECIDLALGLYPTNIQAHMVKIDTLCRLDKPIEALDYVQRALRTNHFDPSICAHYDRDMNNLIKLRDSLEYANARTDICDSRIGYKQKHIVDYTSGPDSFADLTKIDIPKTEDNTHEFKEHYIYDGKMDKEGNQKARTGRAYSAQAEVARAIAGFANSEIGGFLFIGIDSNGVIRGIQNDMQYGKFNNYEDDFGRHIASYLVVAFGDAAFVSTKIKVGFRKIDDKTICIIQVIPSDREIFRRSKGIDPEFYLRVGPQTLKLTGLDMSEYIKRRFKQ